jgi:hypothetical protein
MTITEWQGEHPVRPDPASGLYLRPDGTTAFPAKKLIDWAYPPFPGQPERNRAVRAACATHARHTAGKGPAVDLEKVPGDARQAVGKLIGHKFWERLEVLGAPVHTGYPGDPFATTLDLLVRFRDGGENGVASVQTAAKGGVRQEAVMADLGAALYHLGDIHRTSIAKAFVIWVQPAKVELEMIDADSCTLEWYQAIQLSRWEERRGETERNRVIQLSNTGQ